MCSVSPVTWRVGHGLERQVGEEPGRHRASREYGIRDTMMALREAQLRGVHTFCITVDPAGHDYLRAMRPDERYLVIDDIGALPDEPLKVDRALTT